MIGPRRSRVKLPFDQSRTTRWRCATTCAAMLWLASLSCTNGLSPNVDATARDGALTATLRVLDGAARRLASPAADSAAILRDAALALPPDADDRARIEIRTFLSRAPAPGAEYRCSGDFIRTRARQMLLRLRDTLLQIETVPVEPAVCYADPFALDPSQARADRVVDIYGYDFDAAPLQLVTITRDGFHDVTPALTVASHAHLAVKVGEGGVPVSAAIQSFGLAWGHVIHHRVPVIAPATRLCASRVESIPAGRIVSHLPVVVRPGGPSEADLAADLRLDFSYNMVEATLCVTAADPIASGCTTEFLYTTDPDRVIDGVFGSPSEAVSFPRGDRSAAVRSGGREGPVGEWTRVADSEAAVTARLNEIRVVSSEGEGCISPITYLEAQRTIRLAPETRRALDAQLRSVDPTVLTLRPRFVPTPR
jgi:hypothetical protein